MPKSCVGIVVGRRLGWCVALVFGVAATAAGECPIDNFDDRSDDGWHHCGEWSEGQVPIWDAGSGSYCLGLKHPVRAPPPPPLSIAAQWTRPGSEDARPVDGCLRVGFRAGTAAAGTWNTHFFVSLRADCRDSGYKAMLGPSLGRISIYRRMVLLADEPGHPFEEGRAYRVEFCARGPQLSLKYWALGANEPAEPQLRAADRLFADGLPGVGVFIENDNRGPILRGCFDDVRFVPVARCPGDVDCSGAVDVADLRAAAAAWGAYAPCQPRRPEDLDGDCAVGFSDTLEVLKAWGACPTGP